MDLVIGTPTLPRQGETVLGTDFQEIPGGKGANQAVGLARLGVPTQMVGRLGRDSFAGPLSENLQAAGCGVRYVTEDPTLSSGVALITVAQGANTIVVAPGASGALSSEDVLRARELIQGAAILLVQLEVNLEAVITAVELARSAGVAILLDPAPARPLPPSLLEVDWITPNETEIQTLTGLAPAGREGALAAARALGEMGPKQVVLKRGGEGSLYWSAREHFFLPALELPVVDTTAAGDAYNAGLAKALIQGASPREAMMLATLVAGLSVGKWGAQPSLPSWGDVQSHLVEGKGSI